MNLGRNLLAGFANSAWTAVVGLVAAPFYVRVLGMEAYGLIGFFMATQALFLLLDMGMAPTINREVARSLGQPDRSPVRNLLHSLSLVFWLLSATIGLLALTSAPWISRYWLTSHQLPPQVIYQAVVMMGVIIALRLPVGLYVGVLMGAQKMVLASGVPEEKLEIILMTRWRCPA